MKTFLVVSIKKIITRITTRIKSEIMDYQNSIKKLRKEKQGSDLY